MTFEFKGFAQGLLSGEAFSQIEAELESAVKDKEAPPTAEAAATLGAGGEQEGVLAGARWPAMPRGLDRRA